MGRGLIAAGGGGGARVRVTGGAGGGIGMGAISCTTSGVFFVLLRWEW